MYGKLFNRRNGWVLSLLPGILRKTLPRKNHPQTQISIFRQGDRQIEGFYLIDTFSPLINWATGRHMLIL